MPVYQSVSVWNDIAGSAPTQASDAFVISTRRHAHDEPDDREYNSPRPLGKGSRCGWRLSHIMIELDNGGTEYVEGTDQVTWWLTLDAAGRVPITRRATTDIVPANGDLEYGGVAEALNVLMIDLPNTAGLYVWAYQSTGTPGEGAEARARVFWEPARRDCCPKRCKCGG